MKRLERSIGLAANVPASESWGLQLGGSYSQKGGRFLLDRLREVVRFAPYLAAHLAVYRYAIYHER